MLHYLGVNLMSTEEEAVLFELIKKKQRTWRYCRCISI